VVVAFDVVVAAIGLVSRMLSRAHVAVSVWYCRWQGFVSRDEQQRLGTGRILNLALAQAGSFPRDERP